jgi:hypothetical protein
MLHIRSSQKDVFDAYSLNQYKAELCRHLTRYDSLLCGAAGPEALKETVDLGVQQAHEFGFTLNGPIRTYLEIMLALGSHFDRDPQYFWLVPWLRPQDRYPEMERARYLQFHVIRYLNDVQGSDGANGIVALKKAQEVTRDQLIKIGSNYPGEAMNWLESMHRLKCRFIGEKALQSLIHSARKEAAQAELHGPQSVPLVLGLMFTFGSGILRDPMYPWVARTLTSTYEKGEETREEKLLRKGITYLKKMLQQIQAIQNNV